MSHADRRQEVTPDLRIALRVGVHKDLLDLDPFARQQRKNAGDVILVGVRDEGAVDGIDLKIV